MNCNTVYNYSVAPPIMGICASCEIGAIVIGALAVARLMPGVGVVTGIALIGSGTFCLCLTTILAYQHCNSIEEAVTPDPPIVAAVEPLTLIDELKTLMALVEEKASYEVVKTTFLEKFALVNTLLRDETERILQGHGTKEDFGTINHAFQDILLYLMSHEPKAKHYLYYYKEHLAGKCFVNTSHPAFFFEKLFPENRRDQYCDFIHLFLSFRRHGVLRFFTKELAESTKCNDPKILELLRGTWFHGTCALTTLADTNFTLIPSGMMHRKGIVPFFGELDNGAVKHGVNARALSGTYLDRISYALRYADGKKFKVSIKKHWETIEWLLEVDFRKEDEDDVRIPELRLVKARKSFSWAVISLKRVAKWDPEKLKPHIPKLIQQLEAFFTILDRAEKLSEEYILERYGDIFFPHKDNVLHALTQMKEFLTAPLPAPLTDQQKRNIQESLPAVLGSFTLLSRPAHDDEGSGERLVRHEVKLGTDIQLLCVHAENLERAQKWLQDNQLDSQMKVVCIDDLISAGQYNRRVYRALADVFSVKKFEALCGENGVQLS